MAEVKTKVTKASVTDFIRKVPGEQKRKDALVLLKIFKSITGEKPKMWGPSMIGFGLYHYKSERSTQQGDWPLAAFSPRKQSLTIYLLLGSADQTALLKKLGKHKKTGSCLYINKLEDVRMPVLRQIVKDSFAGMKKKYK